MPRGGPDGGDGGRGGSVYVRVNAGETMLRDYRYRHHFRADPGGRGEGSKRHGKAGHDLYLNVPPGTLVRDAATGDLLADLVSREQEVMVARGGRGGLGNVHFATAVNRAPTHAQKGEPGRGAPAAARAAPDRGCRPRRAAQRGQVDAARRAVQRDARGRRLSVHDADAEPGRARSVRLRRRGRATCDRRRHARPDRGSERRGRAWSRVPAPRRTHAPARSRRRHARPEIRSATTRSSAASSRSTSRS